MTNISFKIYEQVSKSELVQIDNVVANEKRLSYLAKKAEMDYSPSYFEKLFVIVNDDNETMYPLSTWI